MPNGTMPNPLAAPLSSLKQMGTQAVQGLNSLNTGLSTTLNQGIDALIMGAPPIPGMPGAPAAGVGLPTPQQLMPANLAQALGQIENVLIPPGMPRPSQALGGVGAPIPTPLPQPTPTPSGQPTAQAVSGRRRITELGGL